MGWEYAGIGVQNIQYQRHDEGIAFLFTPLRFPGQYYDEETGLHESWNRFYSPNDFRYYQPEPLLRESAYAREFARLGRSLPIYGYALNSPLLYVDRDGRIPGIPYSDFFTPSIGLIVAASGGDLRPRLEPAGWYWESFDNKVQQTLGRGSDTTYGNIVCYSRRDDEAGAENRPHDEGHLIQYEVLQLLGLGELYLPAHILAQAHSAVASQVILGWADTHVYNVFETQPLQPRGDWFGDP